MSNASAEELRTDAAHRPLDDRGAVIFVWVAWLALLLIALGYVQRYAPRLPCGDDWALFVCPVCDGRFPPLPELWSQASEHRVPLVKLILLPLALLTHGAFRVENFLNVLALAGLTAVSIQTARRLRGRQRFTDAFFPLALLHLGHFEVFTGRLTLNHVLSAVLTGLVLVLILFQRGPLRGRRFWLLGGLLVCLPLCGANGLPVVVLTAAWLMLVITDGEAPWQPLCRHTLGALLFLLVGFYLVGLAPRQSEEVGLQTLVQRCGEVLTMATGRWSDQLWPWVAFVAPAALGLTMAALIQTWKRDMAERARVLGLIFFFAAMSALVVAIAWGRAGWGKGSGGTSRYAVITAPILLAVYLTWAALGSARLRPRVELALFVLMCAVYPFAAKSGYRQGEFVRGHEQAFIRALQDGAPLADLAPRGACLLYPPTLTAHAADCMLRLKAAGVAPFDQLRDAPELYSIPLDLTPAREHRMTRAGDGWHAEGMQSHLLYQFPEPRFIQALRLRFSLDPQARASRLRVSWGSSRTAALVHQPHSAMFGLAAEAGERTLVVWINEELTEFRIHPDLGPCEFTLREVTLLGPAAKPDAVAATSKERGP